MAEYIDPGFGGTSTGSKATPWKTITDITWTAGETYYWLAGTTDTLSADFTFPATTSIDVTLGSYTATEDDSYAGSVRPILSRTTSGSHFTIIGDRTGITIKDLDFLSTENATGRQIYAYSVAGTGDGTDEVFLLIENCIFRDGNQMNLRLYCSQITVRNCIIEGADTQNIWCGAGENILIEGCHISGSGRGASAGCWTTGSGATGTGDNLVIRNCTLIQTSGASACLTIPGKATSVGCIVEDCTILSDSVTGVTLNGLGTIFRRNKLIGTGSAHKALLSSTETGDGNYEVYNNVIINNTTDISDSGWEAIVFLYDLVVYVHHNTVVSTSGQTDLFGLKLTTVGAGSVVHSNIFTGMHTGMGWNAVATDIYEYNNCIDVTNHPLALTYDTSIQMDNSVTDLIEDPQLDYRYMLEGTSPCIGAGHGTPSLTDYTGRTANSTYDMGGLWFDGPLDSTQS